MDNIQWEFVYKKDPDEDDKKYDIVFSYSNIFPLKPYVKDYDVLEWWEIANYISNNGLWKSEVFVKEFPHRLRFFKWSSQQVKEIKEYIEEFVELKKIKNVLVLRKDYNDNIFGRIIEMTKWKNKEFCNTKNEQCILIKF